ncbi:hypothetical protein [Roseateles sp. MS654]|uniref:hypothetical protein n=1 Tax=Roseateles sp. MS654 TaxID=3412685 RepID=UPI003C2ACDA3
MPSSIQEAQADAFNDAYAHDTSMQTKAQQGKSLGLLRRKQDLQDRNAELLVDIEQKNETLKQVQRVTL